MDFHGDSVIAVHDRNAMLLSVDDDGLLRGFRTDYGKTYDDEDPEDAEHVFTVLPGPLLVPVIGATVLSRTPSGSAGRPVQISVLSLDELPAAPSSPSDPDYARYEALGPTERVAKASVLRVIRDDAIADPETIVLLQWFLSAETATG